MTDLIAMIANVALTLSVIVALVFGLAQVKAAARDRRERLTLETLRTYQTAEFAEAATFINRTNFPATLKEMYAMPQHDQTILFQFAQQMESLGILVAEGIIDIELVDITLGDYVLTTWKKYKPFFSKMRTELPDPFLGEYFQWLAERIDVRMHDNPREPFYKNTNAANHRGGNKTTRTA